MIPEYNPNVMDTSLLPESYLQKKRLRENAQVPLQLQKKTTGAYDERHAPGRVLSPHHQRIHDFMEAHDKA